MNKVKERIEVVDKNIKLVVIKRNNFHPDYFRKEIIYKDKSRTSCGGYKSILEEVIAMYVPNLDRFDDGIKERVMETIHKSIIEAKEQLEFCMDFSRKDGSCKYVVKDLHKAFDKNFANSEESEK